ncbi:hypothetical protein ACQPXT_34495 [Streptomyces sp. CA-100214]
MSKAKEFRGETGGHADVQEMPKRAARRQPAKKSAAKKTARKSKMSALPRRSFGGSSADSFLHGRMRCIVCA